MKNAFKNILRKLKLLLVDLTIKIVGKGQVHNFLGDSLVIDILRRKSGNQLTPFYSLKVFHDVNHIVRKNNYRPTRVMEIGTGSSLTTLACFLADGASRAVGIDIQRMDRKSDQFYKEASRYMAVASGFGWWRKAVDINRSPHITYNAWNNDSFLEYVHKVEYHAPVDAVHLPFPDNSFDFVYSNAVLEHLEKPEEAILELKRILEPGAISFHEIDMRDHNSSNPLEFLTYSEENWQALCGKYGGGKGIERLIDNSWQNRVYCNRLTVSDWRGIFEKNGFRVVELKPICTLDFEIIKRDYFSKPFCNKSLHELSQLVVQFTLQTDS